jgi:hypothetical protein
MRSLQNEGIDQGAEHRSAETVVRLAGGAMLRAPLFMALFMRGYPGRFRWCGKTYGKVFGENQYFRPRAILPA